LEKSFALSELAARIALARLLASMSFASGWKDEEGKSVGQLPECVPCLYRHAVLGAQRAVVPPACSGKALSPLRIRLWPRAVMRSRAARRARRPDRT